MLGQSDYPGESRPKVSVIVAGYHQVDLATQALDSILAQTYHDLEIIVGDDEATDAVQERWAASPVSITFIRQSSQPLMATLSAGVQATKGDLLWLMRADELGPPSKLEWQVRQLQARPQLGLVYFGEKTQREQPTHFVKALDSNKHNSLDSSTVALEFLLSGCPLFRRECVEQAGLLQAPATHNSAWNPWQQITLAGFEIAEADRAILAKEHAIIFLQKVNQGDIRAAQRHIVEVARLSPAILKELRAFSRLVLDFARRPDIRNPVTFTQTVLDALPDGTQKLDKLRSIIMAELSIDAAFDHYVVGNMSQVRRHIVAGFAHNMAHLRNRGVLSILGRSLVNRNGKKVTSHKKEGYAVLRSAMADVQEALGQQVERVELFRGGSDRKTYLVKSGGRSFVMRLAQERSDWPMINRLIAMNGRVRAAGVPVPRILAAHIPDADALEPAWTIEEWVQGHPYLPHNMAWRDALAIAAELGRCLRHLHSIEVNGFGAIASERLEAECATWSQWLDAFQVEESAARAELPPDALARVEAARQFLRDAFREPPKLCHFDLNPWNFLAERGSLNAIIDWEGMQGCDPAFDVATLHFWIDDEQILGTLLRAYAPAEPDVFRDRVMAAVMCYAAYWMAADLPPTVDRAAIHRRCSRWIADNRLVHTNLDHVYNSL